MAMNRRFVLKSMALGSIAGLTLGGSLRPLAAAAAMPVATGAPVLALVDGSTAASMFLHGVLTGGGNRARIQRVNHDLDFVLNFERQLRSGQPQRIIGLLDDAAATLIVDMARSAGALVPWLGQHSAEAGFSRHRLVTTPGVENCSQEFGRQLYGCGGGFSLNMEQCNGKEIRRIAASSQDSSRAGQWAASIGYLLATLDNPKVLPAPGALPVNQPVTGCFVSFAIEA